MKHSISIILLTFLLNLSAAPHAAAMEDLFPAADSILKVDWNKEGEAYSRISFDTESDGIYEDTGGYDAWVKVENTVRFEEKEDLFLKFDVEGRVVNYWGGQSDAIEEIQFQEAYAQIDQPRYRLAAGRQTVTWGKLDDAVILDRINAQDMRQFFLYEKNERKIPSLMLEADYFADNWQLEAVYMPFLEANEMDFFQSDFSAFGHIKRIIARGASYSAAAKNLVDQITIQDDDSVTDRGWDTGQAALRLRSRIKEVDYGVYFLSVLDAQPTLKEKTSKGNTVKRFLYTQTADSLTRLVSESPSGQDLVLTESHPRVNIVGADFETVLGTWGVRGEIAAFFDKPFLKEDFGYTEKNLLSLGIGLDHTTAQNIYLNLQFVEDIVLDDENLYAQKRDTHAVIGSLSKPFQRGKITANLDFAYNLSWKDWMVNPELTYDFSNGLNAGVGLFVFGGEPVTRFGRYNDKDLAYISLQYAF
jgi:hypothetical protein